MVLGDIIRLFSITDFVDLTVIIVVVLALNLMAGYAGIPNFGMALFVFIGAFVLAGIGTRISLLLVNYVDPTFVESLSREYMLIALKYNGSLRDLVVYGVAGDPIVNRVAAPKLEEIISGDLMLSAILMITIFGLALILGALTGIIASFAAIRLREDYLAIVLLAFSEMMVTVVFDQTDALAGGPNGAWVVRPWPSVLETAIKPLTPGGVKPDIMIALLVSLLILAVSLVYVERIANSPMGRALRAMRDDDLAISVYGRDVASIRLKVMAIGASIASIAGAIYATVHSPVKAVDYNRVDWTFVPWAMMILGGMANNWGVILGAIVVYVGKRLIYYYLPPITSFLASTLQATSWLIVGVTSSTLITLALALLLLQVKLINPKFKVIARYTGVALAIIAVSVLLLYPTIGAIWNNIDIVRAIIPNIFVGILIILVLYLRPQGIVPEKPSKTISRRELEEVKAKILERSSQASS